MPKHCSPIMKIAKHTMLDEARQKSFIIMFAVCAALLFLVRGCYQGNYMVNGQVLDVETIVRAVSKLSFHVVAVAVMLLTALLSMRVFRRDREDGTQACILSKPITRPQYVAGKILGVWAISAAFMFVLHGIVCVIASFGLKMVMAEFLVASLLCCINLLFVVVAVLLFTLLMPDIAAFICFMGIGVFSFVADGIAAVTRSPAMQAMMQQQGPQSDWSWWKTLYYAWPKLSGTQQFASSLISHDASFAFGAIYPLLNVAIFILLLGALLFRRFRNEDIA